MWRKMGVGEVAGRLQTASGSKANGERQQGKRPSTLAAGDEKKMTAGAGYCFFL